MIVQVLRPFKNFIENQIIDTKRYEIAEIDVLSAINSGILAIFKDDIEKIDIISNSLIYKGKAFSGSLDTDNVWNITKITTVGSQIIKEKFYDTSWSNRLSL